MVEVALYLELAGLAINEEGNPAPAGIKFTFGYAPEAIEYAKMAEIWDLKKLAEILFAFCVRPEDITIITPEEYEERYGKENTNGN